MCFCSSINPTHFHQISALNFSQLKATLILSNSAGYPLPGLQCILNTRTLPTLVHPLAHQCIKHYLNILKRKVINHINRKWGISSIFTIFRLSYMYCGTVTCILEAVPCGQLCGLNGKTSKNQPTYTK